MMLHRVAVFAVLALCAASALAQSEAFGLFDDYGATPGDAAAPRDLEPRWRVALGGGLAAAPNFPGSDKYRVRPVPVLFAAYGRFFLGAGGLGMNLYRGSGWRLGASLSPSRGRKESDDARLAGLGDVDRTLRAGLSGGYSGAGWSARGSVITDIAGEGHGTLARFDVFARTRAGEGLVLFAGPGVTWASRQYMQTFFGVTAEQGARSGFPEFEAQSGLNSARVTAGAIRRLDRNWILAASLSAARLSGDAAASPITETRQQYLLFASAAYLFR